MTSLDRDPVILRDIGDARLRGRLEAVAELLPYLPPPASAYGEDAALAVHFLVSRAHPEDVANFDRWYRERPSAHPARLAWERMWLGPHEPWVGKYPATVAIATCHASGFVRESAVRILSEVCHDGTELPFLLVRLNDWVPQVRFAAATGVKARLTAAYAGHWVRSLGLLERLRGGKRAEHEWLRAPVDALLHRDGARAALEEALVRGSVGVRRACVRLAASSEKLRDLLRLALADPDPVASGFAASALCSVLDGEPLRDVLAVLEKGPARVRILALETLCSRFPERARDALRRALMDPTASVRELARFLWTKMGLAALDFRAFYLAELELRRGAPFATALRGLAETGTAEDAPTFLAHLEDPRPQVREAAVLGLGRCDGQKHSYLLLEKVADPNLAVSKAAWRYARLYLGRSIGRPRRRAAKGVGR